MRALFMLTTVVLAVALGVASRWLAPAVATILVIGFSAAVWLISHALERMLGRDIWDFSAPYPYRWTREERVHDVLPRQLDHTEHAPTEQGSSQSMTDSP